MSRWIFCTPKKTGAAKLTLRSKVLDPTALYFCLIVKGLSEMSLGRKVFDFDDTFLLHVSCQIHHFDGSACYVIAFVACFCAGTFDGLFNGVCGQYAEHNRYACF